MFTTFPPNRKAHGLRPRPLTARLTSVVLLMLCALVASVNPSVSAAEEPLAQSQIDPRAAEALSRVKQITVDQATARLARERTLTSRGSQIEQELNGRSGGFYLDEKGELVVTTLDARSDAAVTRSGGRPQRVDDSSAALEAIADRFARQSATGGAGGVQGWFVDVPANTVVMTVSEGADDPSTAAMLKLARGFGSSVRVERRPAEQAPRPAAFMAGGLEFSLPSGIGVCSVGFNTLDSANRNVLMTAGHCVKNGTFSRLGSTIGTNRTTNFPTDDFGTIWNARPSYWQPLPSIYRYNTDTYARLAGHWGSPPVGATVCKSGRTTGYTCGQITSTNAAAAYAEGTVYGLVRHNACVEGGDSGGANVSAGMYALGVTSGADLISGRCRSKYGGVDVSYYQPLGEALSRNGLRLVL